MKPWLALADKIDRLNERLGVAVSWLALVMVLVGAFNAIARYLGRYLGVSLSSNAYLEMQWYLFSVLFLVGAAYTLRCNAHVRVDVLYGRISPRARAWIDLVGTLLFLIPFATFVLVVSWEWVLNSWRELEGSPDPGGLPRFPLKSIVLVAFLLLILQGVSIAVRQIAVLRGETPLETDPTQPTGEGL